MATCKQCNSECNIKKSGEKAKNPGKEFYSCPSGCKGWIGWVDEAPKTNAVKKPYSSTNTQPSTTTTTSNGASVKCNACSADCIQRESNTDKNRGKKFWACTKGCKVWNGWIDEPTKPAQSKTPVTTSASTVVPATTVNAPKIAIKYILNDDESPEKPMKPAAAPPTVSTKRKAPSINSDEDDDYHQKPPVTKKTNVTNNNVVTAVTKKPMISYYCIKCDKTIDIDHEIDNNIKRYSKSLRTPVEMLRLNLKSELLETITNGDYTCESCLGNE